MDEGEGRWVRQTRKRWSGSCRKIASSDEAAMTPRRERKEERRAVAMVGRKEGENGTWRSPVESNESRHPSYTALALAPATAYDSKEGETQAD